MRLIKTHAAYRNENGEWVQQQDVLMHPLEEQVIRAMWEKGKIETQLPVKPTKEQEFDWLVDFSPEYVRLKRNEYNQAYEDLKPKLDAAHKEHQVAHKAWCDHAEDCVSKGLNPDTHEIEKHLHLLEKYKD